VTPQSVLEFWFEDIPQKRWFVSDAAFDARIRRRFAKAIETEARREGPDGHPWEDTADGALALIILFDQLTRNTWRGSGKAFEFDGIAHAVALRLVDTGLDWTIQPERRAFVYMPFMHSESLEDQDLCIALCTERLPEGNGTVEHARKHRDVIARFGRFPYRNDALGRASTPEEVEYLTSGGYAPGAKRPANSAASAGKSGVPVSEQSSNDN
jgi:uncharacterized protein (DUF924 family)